MNSFTWGQGWAVQIYPYVKSTGVYKCPDDGFAPPATSGPGNAYATSEVSYVYNKNMTNEANLGTPASPALADQASPAKTVLLAEGSGAWTIFGDPTSLLDGYTVGVYAGWLQCDSVGQGMKTGWLLNHIISNGTSTCTANGYPKTGWHTDASNFLLADGHVKWIRGSQISGGTNAQAADCNTFSANSSPSGDSACTRTDTAAGTNVTTDTGHGNNPIQATYSIK